MNSTNFRQKSSGDHEAIEKNPLIEEAQKKRIRPKINFGNRLFQSALNQANRKSSTEGHNSLSEKSSRIWGSEYKCKPTEQSSFPKTSDCNLKSIDDVLDEVCKGQNSVSEESSRIWGSEYVTIDFCEECDEIDDFCEKCKPTKQSSFPKTSDCNLKNIDDVLDEVCSGMILSNKKIEGRNAFVKKLEGYISKLYPGVELRLFGSSVNSFGSKKSDVDICMTFRNEKIKDIDEQRKILGNVTRHLRKNSLYKDVFGIYRALIPIIKFRFEYPECGIIWNCDLSLNNVLAVHNSNLLCKYGFMDERCRILGCALKHLAKKANIADTSSQSLSSYSYILMVIHYLQQVEPPVLPVLPVNNKEAFEEYLEVPPEVLRGQNFWCVETLAQLKRRYGFERRNKSSAAELWVGLLEYYLEFDLEYAVTITEKGPVQSSSLLKYARLFNIEDPFLSGRNLGSVVSESKCQHVAMAC